MSDALVVISDVGAQGQPGSLGFANAEVWDSATTYKSGRVVSYLGILYVSIARTTDEIPSATPSSWAYLNLATIDNLNENLAPILDRLATLEQALAAFTILSPYPSTILFPSIELYPSGA